MKKFALSALILTLPLFSSANPGRSDRVFGSGLGYPSANVAYYAEIDQSLAQAAKDHCKLLQKKVGKISSIQIQIDGDFELHRRNHTSSVTYPRTSFSALVDCH